MYDDPGTISFKPHNQNQNQNPTSTENEISYTYWRNQHQETMENDAESPRLWKDSPGPSPSHPLLFPRNSRAEAIVRGQWELMEMVKNMPESSYELSLKDMVEHQRSIETPGPESGPVAGDLIDRSLHRRAVVKVKRLDDQSRKIDRSLSLENNNNKGLFLNMVFPFSFKSNKKNNSVKKAYSKSEGLKESDWWKKKFRGSTDSDSSRTSAGSSTSSGGTGSSSGGGRKKNGLLSACWPFFHSRSKESAN